MEFAPGLDRVTIHRDALLRGIDSDAEFTNRLAVDRHAAAENDLLTRAPRGHACFGQEFLQAHGVDDWKMPLTKSCNWCWASVAGWPLALAIEHAKDLGLWFGFAQTHDAVARFPLIAFLQQFHAFEALQYILFCAGGSCVEETLML